MFKTNTFILFIVCIVFCGCAKAPLSTQDKQELLGARVDGYILALQNNDLVALYEFTSPAYRKMVSLQHYIKVRNISYKDISLASIDPDLEQDKAKVILSSTMSAMGFDFKNFKIKQNWIFVDDNWYEDLKPSTLKGLMQ